MSDAINPQHYQPMNGAWYRVLTLDGEVIEKMQWRAGAFHGLRGRVLDIARVERVSVRFAPGVDGGSDRWHDVNPPLSGVSGRPPVFERARPEALHTTGARRTYGDLPAALLVLLDDHGPQTTTQLAERMPERTAHAIRTTLSRMTHAGTVSRHPDGGWQIGAPAGRTKPARETEAAWTPAPWIHPIRRRLLGLPVAQAPRDVPETDFGNPLRKVAA